MKSVGLLCITMLVLCGTAYAERTVWYVHPDSALNSIQAALDSCADNDIVLVAPGIYHENIVWPNIQGVHLIGELGPDATVVDGDSIGRVIEIAIDVDTTTIITGFTIRNGHIPDNHGGGIHCAGASPKIIDNIISSNIAWNGGGIACDWCSPLIMHNIIVDNTAIMGGGWGGGIRCIGSSATITGNTIANNAAANGGGGVQCLECYDSLLIIHDNIFTGNTAYAGAAICLFKSSPIFTKNQISYNIASAKGGGIFCYDESSPIIKHNTITGNTADDGAGIYCMDSSSPAIDSCMISNNHGDGVYLQPILYGGPSCPVLHYNDIVDNEGYGVNNTDSMVFIDATYNWWGDASGPYHPTANPGGFGDTVSDYVDFDPWLVNPGVEERSIAKPVEIHEHLTATIFCGRLQLPARKNCRVFDITGRVVEPTTITRGIYFIEIDNEIVQKVIKVR